MGTTSFLSMVEARMPPGFRFHPRDEELIVDYLAKRISSSGCQMMIDVDLNKVEPWDLPGEACVGGKEWYFYSLRDRKYATGQRTNRATVSGYWKATGKDRPVIDSRRIDNNNGAMLVGMRKTLVFYKGRAPKGKKTDWVMHEFRIETSTQDHKPSSSSSSLSSSKEDWVLCRVFYKSRALSVRPGAATAPAAATATTATTTTADNCYDDTAGSSIDTFVNMEQRQLPPQFNLQGYDQQVPCFSNFLLPSSSSARPPQPSSYQMLAAFPPIGSFAQMGGLPSLGPYLGSISVDNKPSFASLQHHLQKPPAVGPTELAPSMNAATDGTSTGVAFMNTDQSCVQPMWNSC